LKISVFNWQKTARKRSERSDYTVYIISTCVQKVTGSTNMTEN